MRVHRNKPFPISFFDQSLFKIKHYFTWWFICNELDADPDGWIRITRKEFEQGFLTTQKIKPSQLTSILISLQRAEYLELVSAQKEIGGRWYKTEFYEILIKEDAWEPKKVVKKYYPQRTSRSERRNYYQERKARLLAESQT